MVFVLFLKHISAFLFILITNNSGDYNKWDESRITTDNDGRFGNQRIILGFPTDRRIVSNFDAQIFFPIFPSLIH